MMQKEYNLTGKKKNKYPSKTTINLYYKEDKTTRPATVALYVLFILVVGLAVCKVAIYDMWQQLEEKQEILAENQRYLEERVAYLSDYNEVSAQYSRYSYSYLREEEKLCDRMEVLDMLEETVFAESQVDSAIIMDDIVSLTFGGLDLQETAWLTKKIENYEIVKKVDVHTASLNSESQTNTDQRTTTMVITLVEEHAEDTAADAGAGGESL